MKIYEGDKTYQILLYIRCNSQSLGLVHGQTDRTESQEIDVNTYGNLIYDESDR